MHFFVGWDVGAWGCRTRSRSQDALVVLAHQDNKPCIVGRIWRGNLSRSLQREESVAALVAGHCETNILPGDKITIAIDTPLGLPADTLALYSGTGLLNPTLDSHSENSLIFRQTEIWLAARQFPPLSAIKDMIGSQSTKGIYLLRKFGLTVSAEQCGIWANENVTAIECYPTTCKRSDRKGYICQGSESMQGLYGGLFTEKPEVATDDEEDAVYCALVAYTHARHRDALVGPEPSTLLSEGWIWYPTDAIGRQSKKKSKRVDQTVRIDD